MNPFDLRDGTSRDVVSQNMEVVLNVRHVYDIDVEDLEELVRFRILWFQKLGKMIMVTRFQKQPRRFQSV